MKVPDREYQKEVYEYFVGCVVFVLLLLGGGKFM